jgi:CubicO group peptidase (beta-lactamase class C family)
MLLAAALCVPFAAVASPTDDSLAARLDAAIAAHYPATGPGASVIVTRDGKTVLRKAYGMADVAAKLPMQAAMTQRIGSLTKQFTATAILMLADEGKLALSDPITKFLPDYPARGKTITIEHLLTHTSGLVNYTSKPAFHDQMAQEKKVAEVIDWFKDDALISAPGSAFAYNNSGYFLLGAVIEKISGLRYGKFVEQRIFVPLGMTQTAFEGMERTPGMRAAGHTATSAGFGPSAVISPSLAYAAGALTSSVDDLARWDKAITEGKLLRPATWARAFTPYTLASGISNQYGYGWYTRSLRGSPALAHGGNSVGYTAYAVRLPRQNVYVALLVNSDSGMSSPEIVAKKAAAIAIDNSYPDFKAVALDPATLDSYAGVYKVDEKSVRTVRREQDHLSVQRAGRGEPVKLYPRGGDRFFASTLLTQFRFERDAQGAVTRLVLDDDGVETIAQRTGQLPE